MLNIIGIRTKNNWWELWRPKKKAIAGIRPKGEDTAFYRKSIRPTEQQPFKDSVEFHWRGRASYDKFNFELVLTTGRPSGQWRTVLDSKFDERGSTAPV